MRRFVLPEGLAPGRSHLTGDELVAAQASLLEAIDEDEQEMARLLVRMARNRAAIVELWSEKPAQGIVELSGTARIGQHRATRQIEDDTRLIHCFPAATQLVEQGRMLAGTCRMLLKKTKKLNADLQLQVDQRISVEIAGLDAVDAREVIERVVTEIVDDEEARREHEEAKARRGVWVIPVEDGMARIGAEVDALDARRFSLDLDELTRLQGLADERAGTERSTAQRRADVLTDLPSRHLALLKAIQDGTVGELVPDSERESYEQAAVALLGSPVRNPILMYVHAPVTTLLDLDNRAGYVEGLGVIPAYRARLLRPTVSMSRLLVDHASGVPLGLDETVLPPLAAGPPASEEEGDLLAPLVRERLLRMLRPATARDDAEPRHDPSAGLRRRVEIRDQLCDGPGCPVSARRCEADHGKAWAGEGQTGVWNIFSRSPRCHHVKHDGWTVERDEDTGDSTWTSPTGRVYVRQSIWRRHPEPPTPSERWWVEPTSDYLAATDPREPSDWPLWRDRTSTPLLAMRPASLHRRPAFWDDGPPPF